MLNYNDIKALDDARTYIDTATLKAHRDALNAQIDAYPHLKRAEAVEMARAFVAEHGLAEAYIFPEPRQSSEDFFHDAIDASGMPCTSYEQRRRINGPGEFNLRQRK